MIKMADSVADVRALLADPASPDQRWTDTHLEQAINGAVRILLSLRPDASLQAFVEIPPDTPSDGELPVSDTYQFAITLHSAGSVLLERASDKSLRDQGNAFIAQAIKLMGV